MFKKRVIILFFILFLGNLFAESTGSSSDKKYIDEAYKKDIKEFYVEGILEYEDNSIKFNLYREKNSYSNYNLSIKVDDELFKLVSNSRSNLINKNGKKTQDTFVIPNTNIPIDILNYGLFNRDYILLGKPNSFSYKNIPGYKVLIKEREPEPVIQEVLENKSDDTLESEIIDKEDPDNKSLTDEEKLDSEDVTNSEEKELHIDNKKENSNKKSITSYDPAKYKKVIYYISEKRKTVLKKEFYLLKEDKKPAYVIEAENIKYIKNNYIVTSIKISDIKNKKSLSLKYNIETIQLKKDQMPKDANKLKFFSGVK